MKIRLPEDYNLLKTLKVGDRVELTATIYTARDDSYRNLTKENNKELLKPFNGGIIFYAGPTPTKPNDVIGAIGPTTSFRMDKFSEFENEIGLIATIGKGEKGDETIKTYRDNHMIYFIATGGIAALLKNSIIDAKEYLYEELGCESIKELKVKDFPLIIALDYNGNYIFEK